MSTITHAISPSWLRLTPEPRPNIYHKNSVPSLTSDFNDDWIILTPPPPTKHSKYLDHQSKLPNKSSKALSFLGLPPELRNKVYHHLYLNQDRRLENPSKPTTLATSQKYSHVWPRPLQHDKLPVALLRTCHQIQSEASPILYGNNTFRFANHTALQEFFSTIGKQAAALLRDIELSGLWFEERLECAVERIMASTTVETLILPYFIFYNEQHPPQSKDLEVEQIEESYGLEFLYRIGDGMVFRPVSKRIECLADGEDRQKEESDTCK